MARRRVVGVFLAVFVVGMLFSAVASAFDAIAVSPDGKICVVGGSNRALVIYDTAKWEVLKKVFVGPRIKEISFISDGSQCMVLGDDYNAYIYSVADWSKMKGVARAQHLKVAKNAPVAILYVSSWGKASIQVLSLPGWTKVKEIALPEKRWVSRTAITDDGKTAYVQTSSYSDPEEKKLDPGPEPTGNDYVAKSIWQKRKDGYVNDFYVVDLEGGKLDKTVVCFDSNYGPDIIGLPKQALIVNSSSYFGLVDLATGKYSTAITGVYARCGVKTPQGEIALGTSAKIEFCAPDGKKLTTINLSRLPGMSESVLSIATMSDKQMVAATDGFRIIVFDPEKHVKLKEIQFY